MYITVGPSDSIVANIGVANIDYYCSYQDPGSILAVQYGTTTGAANYSLIPNPASNYPTQVQAISIYNHSGASATLIIEYISNVPNTRILLEITLADNFTLTYTADGAGFQVYNANGVRQ